MACSIVGHGMLLMIPSLPGNRAGESAVLRRIARYCIEDTGGLFIATRQDDPTYLDRFSPACASAE